MSQTESGHGDRFELFKDAAGEWRWRLRAGNGKIVATSGEGYRRRDDAQTGISIVRRAGDAPVEVVERDE